MPSARNMQTIGNQIVKDKVTVDADKLRKTTEVGTNTLLYGDVGSGKTTSLATWIKAGVLEDKELKLAVVLTEPGGVESLLDGLEVHKVGSSPLPIDRLHYADITPVSNDWNSLLEMSKKVNMMGYRDLTELKSGLEKGKHKQFIDFIKLLANFTDQDGKVLGPIDKLDNSWMFVVDSMTGVSMMARNLVVGLKPAPHTGEWQVMMSNETSYLNQMLYNTKCFTCTTGHTSKEFDQILGKPQYVPTFITKSLSPILPRMFSDVILQVRDGSSFQWSTTKRDYGSLKARNVPLEDKFEPTFHTIYKSWAKRRELANSK